jgi:hypothetical protein
MVYKYLFVKVICLWPAGGNLGGIHASLIFDYLSISIEVKRPTQVILENCGCKFTHLWETAVKLAERESAFWLEVCMPQISEFMYQIIKYMFV